MKRYTVQDLSRLLSLSPSTVSRALADHPDISEATKQRVRDVAKSLHYTPNLRARYLRTRQSRLVALIVPEMNLFFVPSLIAGINRVLQMAGFSLLVFQSDDSYVQERRLVQLCLNLSIDGVLLARATDTAHLEHLEFLHEHEVPVVLLDKTIATEAYSTVTIDDERAGYQAALYLLDRGHTCAIGLFGDPRQRICLLREQGFRRAFAERGHALPDPAVVQVEHLDLFDTYLARAFDALPRASAVFAMSDELLVRAHHFLCATARRVPDEVSLLAISDGNAPYFLHPNVTHFQHAGVEAGEQAAHLLLGHLQLDATPMEVQTRLRLIERASVAVRPAP